MEMNKAEKFFDRVSSRSKPEPNQTASNIIKLTNEYLEKDNYILDFGCGAGTITNKLGKSVQAIEAIDISSGMIELAHKRAEENAIANVNYRQISIFDEHLREGTFDVILAFNVLHYINDIPSLSKRINSLLKADGIFISSTACLKEKRSFLRSLLFALMKLSIMPRTEFYKKSDLESLIRRGNFNIITSKKISSLPEYFIVMRKVN